MNAPRAFIWASHASTMPHLAPRPNRRRRAMLSHLSLNILSMTPRGGPYAGRRAASAGKSGGLGRGGRLLARRLGAEQRGGRLEHVLGELPLGREKLLGE